MKLVQFFVQMLLLLAVMLFAFLYALATASPAGGYNMPNSMPSLPPAPPVHHDTGPTIEQVQKLALLTVTRVDVADVQETTIDGYTGGVRAVIIIKGDVLISVDLTRARFETRGAETRTAVLILPPPQITSPRLDHDKTKLFECSPHGLWLIVPTDAGRTAVINHAYQHAQQVVADAGDNPKLIEQSKQNTEAALKAFFEAAGWGVTIRWNSS